MFAANHNWERCSLCGQFDPKYNDKHNIKNKTFIPGRKIYTFFYPISVWYQNRYLRQGKVIAAQSILWDAITYPWPRCLLLVPKFLYINIYCGLLTFCMFETKPLLEPKLSYCQSDLSKQTSLKFQSNYNNFDSRKSIRKCRQYNVWHNCFRYLDQHLIRNRLVTWRHQTIIWTNKVCKHSPQQI